MMDERRLLMAAVLGLPLLALVITLITSAELSERHHLHHDTYSVTQVVPRTVTVVMLFMGVLGALTGWLCHLGVFSSDSLIPLAFFVSFQVSMLALVIMVARYRVMSYDDRMIVQPALGKERTVLYDRIDSMEWVSSLLGPRLRDLRIHTTDGVRARIWCVLDIEQMLLRIDRFDALKD